MFAGASARGARARVDAFVEALDSELCLRADALDARFGGRPPLETVYLGGGTPTLLASDVVHGILARVRERFGLAPNAEVTAEANPGHDERGDPTALRDAGVTRISYGAQALDDRLLRGLGRRHRVADITATGSRPSTPPWSSARTTCRCTP